MSTRVASRAHAHLTRAEALLQVLCDDLLTCYRVALRTIELLLVSVLSASGRALSPPRNPAVVEIMIGKGDNVLDRHGHRLAHHDPGKRLPTAQHPMLSLNPLTGPDALC